MGRCAWPLANRWRPPSGDGTLRSAVVVMRAVGEEGARFYVLSTGQRRPLGGVRAGWRSDSPSSCTGPRPWVSTPRHRRPSASTAPPPPRAVFPPPAAVLPPAPPPH